MSEVKKEHKKEETKKGENGNNNKEGKNIKLSSCGLVYKYHGREIISNILTKEFHINDPKNIDYTYAKVYNEFIMAIDAGDNGINQYPAEIHPKYHINTHLFSRVIRLNPSWIDEQNEKSDEITSKSFLHGMNMAEEEFLWQVYSQCQIVYPALEFVSKAYEGRHSFHKSGQLLYLEKGCPWKEHLATCEDSNKEETKKPLLFVICGEKDGIRIQGVPDRPGSFQCRMLLREKWRGLRESELEKASGIPGAIFVHSSGFMGICKTMEGVIKMAEETIANPPPIVPEKPKEKDAEIHEPPTKEAKKIL